MLNNELQWSDEAYRIFGLEPKAFKPTYESFISRIHQDDRDRVKKAYEDSLKNKSPYNIEHRLLMPDGKVKFINERCDTEYNDKGEAIRSYGTVQDITDRKRIDEAIQKIAVAATKSEGDDLYQQLVANMAEMFDADYAFIGLLDENNPQQVNTYKVYAHGKIVPNISYFLKGTPCENVVGKESCAYPDHVQKLFPDDKLLVDMGVNSYVGLPLYSNNRDPIGLVVVMDSKSMLNTAYMDEVLKIFAMRTEAELERTQANATIKKLLLAVEQSPSMIIITDFKGDIEYVNPMFTETTGYDREEVIHKQTSIIKSGEMSDDFYKELWETISSGNVWSGMFHNRRRNGELYWDDAKISPIKDSQGKITHYLGVQSDVTDKRQMELKLRQSQKMDALGKLTGGIAHDYNNMLGVISGYADILETALSDQPKLQKYAHEIYNAGLRGAKLTKKLLNFSRHDSYETNVFDLNILLLGLKNMLEKTLTVRIKLTFDLADHLWPVNIDDSDMEDAILNLSINAMHAIEGSGELIVRTRNVQLSKNDAQQLDLEPGDYVSLSLSDTGSGMDEAVKERIFDPFFSTKCQQGTGLGLSQVHGFVERSKAAVKVYTELNHGTQFVFFFPRHIEAGENKELSQDKVFDDLKGSEVILLVDDEPALLDLIAEVLGTKGYKILRAERGKQALELLASESVDLLLSDVIMPEMDGFQLVSEVQKKYPKIKIQLMSGYADNSHAGLVDNAIQENLLHKPVSSKVLLQRVRELLDEK